MRYLPLILGLLPWLGFWLGKRSRGVAMAVLVVLSLATGVLCAWPLLIRGGNAENYRALARERGYTAAHYGEKFFQRDCDVQVINRGLARTHRFADTWRWWTGPWVMDVIPYWRPVPSLVFWGEWKLFGTDYDWWSAVTFLLEAALVLSMFWALAPVLTPGGAATVVLITFVGLKVPWYREMPIAEVVAYWKNQPDLLAGLGIMGAVGFAVRDRLWLSVAASVLAVSCKELGFTSFLLVPATLAWMQVVRGQRCPWGKVAMWNGIAALALGAWHYYTVGIGYQPMPNVHWGRRMLVYYGGTPTSYWVTGQWWSVVLSVAYLVGGWYLMRKPYRGLAALVGVTALVSATLAVFSHDSFAVALTRVLDGSGDTLRLMAWMGTAALGWSGSPRVIILGVAWMLIGAAPTFMKVQVGSYAQWLGTVGQAVIAVGVMASVWEALGKYRPALARIFGPGK